MEMYRSRDEKITSATYVLHSTAIGNGIEVAAESFSWWGHDELCFGDCGEALMEV